MIENSITVSKDVLIEAYKNANVNVKETLECIFGKEMFCSENIMERVKTFEDAVLELGKDHPLVQLYYDALEKTGHSRQEDVLAYLKLRIITAALNEGWKPQFTEDEGRYKPCFIFYTQWELDHMSKDERANVFLLDKPIDEYAGVAYASSHYVPMDALSAVSSRLCFKSKELAEYAGKQFIDIYTDFYLF